MKSNTFVQIVTILALLLFTRLTFAQQTQFEDWMVSSTSGPAAFTSNKSGKLVLYRVQGPSYMWGLEQTGLNCGEMSEVGYLIEIGTNQGAIITSAVCLRDGKPRFIFTETDLVTKKLQRATQVSIVVTAEDGDHSFRFSLRGMADAVALLESIGGYSPVTPPATPPVIHSDPRCHQLWDAYHYCQEDFKRCTVATRGRGPCPACFLPNCPE